MPQVPLMSCKAAWMTVLLIVTMGNWNSFVSVSGQPPRVTSPASKMSPPALTVLVSVIVTVKALVASCPAEKTAV
jgi:hypothetical protein